MPHVPRQARWTRGPSRLELPSPVTRDGQTERQRLRENEAKMGGQEREGENRDVKRAGRRLGADTGFKSRDPLPAYWLCGLGQVI